MMNRRATTSVMLLALSLGAGCNLIPSQSQNLPPPQKGAGGSGTIRVDGVEQAYRVVEDQSSLLLLVKKNEGDACSFFHHHAVAAQAVAYSFALDPAQPGSSTLTARVVAAGLDPDDASYREQFPETAGSTMTDRERQDIRVNMLDQLDAANHPELTFTARNLSTLDGAGTADVTVDVKGRSSTLRMEATARWEDNRLIMEGAGVLDGTQHDIPVGTFKDCVNPSMGLKMRVVLEPGESSGTVPDAGVVEEFQRQFYPPDGDCGEVGYSEVRQTLLVRCAGCHSNPPTQGATVPLMTWYDYRYDSVMSPGRPLYLDVAERILDSGGRRMPPEGATPLTTDEISRVLTWAATGGHMVACNDNGTPPGGSSGTPGTSSSSGGTSGDPGACDPVGYADVEPIVSTWCTGCHRADGPQVALDSYEAGLQPTSHPAYQSLNRWQASAARMEDQSMPPGGGPSSADVELVRRWVNAGTPREPCASGGNTAATSSSSSGAPPASSTSSTSSSSSGAPAGSSSSSSGGASSSSGGTSSSSGGVETPDAGTCDPVGYADVEPIMSSWCTGCHRSGGAQVPLDSYQAGLQATSHPAYRPMNRWEASAARMEDQSMPPGGNGPSNAEIDLVRRWVNAGTPEQACEPGNGASSPDAGSPNEVDAGEPSSPPDAGGPEPWEPTCTSGTWWDDGDHGSSRMHPGGNCMNCHSREDGPTYKAAGTVMGALHDETDCNGVPNVTVRITDANGAVIELLTNTAGNFKTSTSIAKPYTAEVVDALGNVRRMFTPQTDGNCMNCHTMEGANGAPGRIIPPAP
ncbi:MAG: YceI family protein [Myxococcota bacterium]